MRNIRQLEKHADKVLGKSEKRLFLIMITDTGSAWELRAEHWDGKPGTFDEADTRITYYSTAGEAEAAADSLRNGCRWTVPVIACGDMKDCEGTRIE